jgi:septum formation protein
MSFGNFRNDYIILKTPTEDRMSENNSTKVVLASGSPRRKQLLSTLGLPFEVVTSGVPEDVDPSLGPTEMVKMLAIAKADAVTSEVQEGVVIGSDTTISFEGVILGKPKDQEDAFKMLQMLRGKWHQVISGVAVIQMPNHHIEVSSVVTNIKMRNYSDEEISKYIETGEPMDKAGSYAIQGIGGALVENIDGCYNNVVGFPLCELVELLGKNEISVHPNGPVCKLPSGDACPRLS